MEREKMVKAFNERLDAVMAKELKTLEARSGRELAEYAEEFVGLKTVVTRLKEMSRYYIMRDHQLRELLEMPDLEDRIHEEGHKALRYGRNAADDIAERFVRAACGPISLEDLVAKAKGIIEERGIENIPKDEMLTACSCKLADKLAECVSWGINSEDGGVSREEAAGLILMDPEKLADVIEKVAYQEMVDDNSDALAEAKSDALGMIAVEDIKELEDVLDRIPKGLSKEVQDCLDGVDEYKGIVDEMD